MATGFKTGGRSKGTPNKVASDIREKFNLLIEGQLDNLDGWINEVAKNDPKAALDTIIKLAEFVIPKLSRIQTNQEPQEVKQFVVLEYNADADLITD